MPGFIGGFDQPAADAAFDRLFQAATSEWGDAPFWCCASWGNADQEYRKFYYAPPAPLAGGWRPWQPPKLALPPWCDAVSGKHHNSHFARLPQHPCAFLRNATAAALAAAGIMS